MMMEQFYRPLPPKAKLSESRNQRDVRPRPGPLPQERENRSPLP
jgi:hypothetical protein